jgi:hypothetical protein
MTLLALLQAGGSMLQGAFSAAGAQQENNMNQAMQRRRALRLGDVAGMLENMNSMARLPQAYSRSLSGSVGASRASAGMRGLAGSGVQADLEARMQGEALAQLAGQVNQQEMQRLQMLGNIYADPAFGALEQSEMPNANGLIALQGLLGAGMSLAPLLGNLPGPQPEEGPNTDEWWDFLRSGALTGSGGAGSSTTARAGVPQYFTRD